MNGPRVAIVTGAAQGIGLAIADRLVALGHVVIRLDQQVIDDPHAIVADVADRAGIAAAVAQVEHAHGRIDILVNNAGISPSNGGRPLPVEDIDFDEWDRVLAINLTGTFQMCRAVLPIMKRGCWGRIVNFSSQGGRMRSLLSGAHYAATKAGLIGFTRVLAGQAGAHGITANCIAPGRIDSPQSRVFGDPVAYASQVPVGRIGVPDDIADGVAYLVSEGAGFVTGTVLDVNGGWYMP